MLDFIVNTLALHIFLIFEIISFSYNLKACYLLPDLSNTDRSNFTQLILKDIIQDYQAKVVEESNCIYTDIWKIAIKSQK